MSKDFDVVVIGAGPAGYVAAIRCAQLGLKTACVDAWINHDGKPAFGGTCLNAGCIPSKALLESSEMYHKAQHEFALHGVQCGDVDMDITKMQARKDGITKSLTGGIKALFMANKVEGIHGKGKILGQGKVEVTPTDGDDKRTITCDNIIIATGSEPVNLKIAPFDGNVIVDSWGALEFTEAPKRLGVIGAGIIGLELGSVWGRLGSEVTLLEAQNDFLFMADQQIAKEALKQFKKQDLNIQLGARVLEAQAENGVAKVEYELNGEKQSVEFDKLIVSVGRRPYTDGLASTDAGLDLDEKGFVDVRDGFRTSLPNVYAVGDVIGGAMLAHKGSEEGIAVAEIIAGNHGHVNYDAIPSVVYTHPEIAWVGKTEEQVKSEGLDYRTGSFPFSASGRAKAMEAAVGQVKFIADANTDRILGVHMVGPFVSELVAEMVLAMEYGASSEDIALTMHAHPTLSEAVHEAALAVDGRAIHAVNKRK